MKTPVIISLIAIFISFMIFTQILLLRAAWSKITNEPNCWQAIKFPDACGGIK